MGELASTLRANNIKLKFGDLEAIIDWNIGYFFIFCYFLLNDFKMDVWYHLLEDHLT